MDLMLDLETFGKQPKAVFTQIGWCLFDPSGAADQVMEKGTIYVSAVDAQRCGLELDADTVLWWLRQDATAQQQMILGGKHLLTAMEELYNLVAVRKPARIWANSLTFDIAILEHAFQAVEMQPPWKYWDIFDVRTIVNLTLQKWQKHRPEVAHVAELDCAAQAKDVIVALQRLYRP